MEYFTTIESPAEFADDNASNERNASFSIFKKGTDYGITP